MSPSPLAEPPSLNVAVGGYLGGPAGAGTGLLLALGGAAVGLAVFGTLAAGGLIGMGDVKLVAALGALVRWPLAVPFLLYAALAGGVIALAHALRRRRVTGVAMPYALAISAADSPMRTMWLPVSLSL